MMIIDTHTHLWLWQDAMVDGHHNYQLPNGRAMFMGEEVQMLPPFMTDNRNSAETLLSNMDYAQVSAAVVTQELIDGLQNDYLRYVEQRWPHRFFCFGMCEYRKPGFLDDARYLIRHGFRGIKVPAARLIDGGGRIWLNNPEFMEMFRLMEAHGMILGVELADGDRQVGELCEVIEECGQLKVVIGHFGMVTRDGWMEQIKLARHQHVYIDSGGMTWLFNHEGYPFGSAVRAIRQAADEVGMDKLMWGSDYPRTITAITYRQAIDWVVNSDGLTAEEKRLFMGENARRLFGFAEAAPMPHVKNMSE